MAINDNTISVRLSADAQELQKALSQGKGYIEDFANKGGASMRGLGADTTRLQGGMADLAQGMKSAFVGSSVAVGLVMLKNLIADVGAELVDTQIKADKMRNGLSFAVGADKAGAEMAFIRQSAQALGLELVSTGTQYMQLAAAARGTTLAGQQTRDIFTAVAQASTVMGLSAEQSEGALRAISQMISKGKVQAEELRGQLGERLPGAFQIAARSMGVTTAELDKMLVSGNLLATDFLPKFAAQLTQETAPALDQASKSMQASVNRMSNAWTDFKRNVNDSGVAKALQNEITGMGNYVQGVSDAMENARKNGSGAIMQLSAGLGNIIARAPFDALSVSSNALNGTLNALSFGALKLNTNLNLLPLALESNAERTRILAIELPKAEKELVRLQARLAKAPDNIYLKDEIRQLFVFIQMARQAAEADARLKNAGQVNPTDQRLEAAGQARLALEEKIKASSADLLVIRGQQAGIDKSYLETLGKLQTAREVGAIGEKEYIAMASKLATETYKKSEAGKAAAQSSRAGAKDLKNETRAFEKQQDILATLSGTTKDYQEQLTLLQVMRAGGLITQEQYVELINAEIARQPMAKKLLEEYTKAQEEASKATAQYYDGLAKGLDKQAESNQKLREQNEEIGLTAEALGELRLQRMDDAIAQEQQVLAGARLHEASQEELRLMELRIKLMKEERGLTSAGTAKTVAAKAAEEASSEWKKFYDDLERGLTDSLYRGFEAGKGFFKTFWDGIKNLFKTTVLKLAVQGVMGGVTGALGLAGAANAQGMGGGMGGMVNMASNASSLLSLTTNTGVLGSIFASSAAYGAAIGTTAIGVGSQAAMLAAQTGTFGAAGLAATSSSAAVAGGVGSGAVGAMAAIPVVGWIALAVAAVAMFGGRGKKEGTGSGITGQLNATGPADVSQYSDWKQKGGWFSSDRTGRDLSGISGDMQTMLDTSSFAITQATKGYASAIGLSADAVNGYSHAISIGLSGLDAKGQQEAIGKALTGFADGMASAYAGITSLSKAGEGASTTLARLASSLTGTNSWLSLLRMRLLQVSLSGAAAAAQLADAFGGLDKLGEASKAYYDAYFSDAEKSADSTREMAAALAAVNLVLPASKGAFRELAEGLDLNTAAGLQAYAVLLAMAPAFDVMAQAASKLAQETAEQLVKTFSGDRKLIPLLAATLGSINGLEAGLTAATATTVTMAGATGSINRLLGVASSGVLYFGSAVQDMGQPLSAAQVAAQTLTDQIFFLKLNASGAVIDINGLSAALANVNTETFMATMTGVFESLAERLKTVLGDIGNERIAVREAALQIINPSVMTKDQIARGIAGANVGMPSNSGVVAAQGAVGAADALVAAQRAALAGVQAAKPSTAALDAVTGTLSAANARLASARAVVADFRVTEGGKFNSWIERAYSGEAGGGKAWDRYVNGGERNSYRAVEDELAARAPQQAAQAAYNQQLATYNAAYATYANQVAVAQSVLNTATAAQTNALTGARAAQLAYIDSLQNYAIDASKAVTKLSRLREETVKYYETQKALADLMTTSAKSLRQTVADYRYAQLDPQQQYEQLQSQFNTAYSMALSTSGDTLAGYGDKLSSLLNPMLEKAKEAGLTDTAYNQLAATALARAEAVAGRIDQLTPTNYAGDSLVLLGQIDSTLAALENGSRSAERIIVDAINAGRDQTVGGLRAVVAALTGQAIPGFAMGGDFAGGLRIVGENGPELEATGAARIFSATQTRGMLSGGASSELINEVRALRQEVAALRADNQAGQGAIAANTGKVARMMTRQEVDGVFVKTNADQPLVTVPA